MFWYLKLNYILFSQRSQHSLGLLCDNISKQSVGQSTVRDQGSSTVPTASRMFRGMFFVVLVAGFLLFTIKPKAIYPFPSGHRTASACFATTSQNSRLAKAPSGIKGAQRYRPPRGCSAECFLVVLVAGFLLFTIKPKAIYLFPSGHRAASACFCDSISKQSIGQSTVRDQGCEKVQETSASCKKECWVAKP